MTALVAGMVAGADCIDNWACKGTDLLLDGGENAFRLAYPGIHPQDISDGVWRLGRKAVEAARGVAPPTLCLNMSA